MKRITPQTLKALGDFDFERFTDLSEVENMFSHLGCMAS